MFYVALWKLFDLYVVNFNEEHTDNLSVSILYIFLYINANA